MKDDYSENTTTGKKIVITGADRDKSTLVNNFFNKVSRLFEGSIKMESSSYSGSSKRAKALSQMPHCLVDGCNADLGLCRDYHRRHKVCEVHSKTSKVTIGGREQRFCQQCSRFHSLVEFDDGKRSCRKRLDGHNRRRRKPQTERNSGLFHSTQQGTTLLSFGTTTQMLPSSVMGSSWTGTVKPDNNIPLYNNHPTPNYVQRQNQQLQFMQGLDQDNKAKIFCDGLNKVVDSNRALSLLSTRPTMTQEFGSNRAFEPEPVPQAVHDLHYYGMNRYSFIVGQEDNLNVSSSHNDASTLHFPETFHHGNKGSSSSGSHQTLTFMWE